MLRALLGLRHRLKAENGGGSLLHIPLVQIRHSVNAKRVREGKRNTYSWVCNPLTLWLDYVIYKCAAAEYIQQ